MATAATANPLDALTDKAVSTVSSASSFFTTKVIPTPATTTAAGAKSATPEDPLKKHTFPLQSEPFQQLNAYLISGIKLPKDEAAFDLDYPRALLEPYCKKEGAKFYDKMVDVLTTIHTHCYDFKIGTMNDGVKLAGSIANFADTAAESSKTLLASLEVMTKPGIKSDDPAVVDAFTNFSTAMSSLLKAARSSEKGCTKVYEGLGKFKTDTENDELRLKEVDEGANRVLPKTADLDAEMKAKMEKAYKDLNEIVKQQNRSTDVESFIRQRIGWFPWIGIGINLNSLARDIFASNAVSKSAAEFEKLFNSLNSEVQAGLRLRLVSSNLKSTISTILSQITLAQSALQHMMSAFQNLANNLTKIDDELANAFDAVSKPHSFLRAGARKHLANAGDTWTLVFTLAKDFAENGEPLVRDVDAAGVKPVAATTVDILGSTYGGVDVTLYSQVLFNSGPDVVVRSVEPGFPEPWKGVKKSISVLNKFGDSLRVFACREYTGTHYIRPGPVTQGNNQGWGWDLQEAKPVVVPKGSKVEILAIVWAQKIVTDEKVWNSVYEALNKKKTLKWTNEDIGGGEDPWSGNKKSGAIYYRFVGGDKIRQACGQEGQEVKFPITAEDF